MTCDYDNSIEKREYPTLSFRPWLIITWTTLECNEVSIEQFPCNDWKLLKIMLNLDNPMFVFVHRFTYELKITLDEGNRSSSSEIRANIFEQRPCCKISSIRSTWALSNYICKKSISSNQHLVQNEQILIVPSAQWCCLIWIQAY